ncbi:MAG: ABC transporter substrate-binding protein [Saezia sp.]
MQPKKIAVMCWVKQVMAVLAALVLSTQVFAKDLVIALRTEPTSMDPHFHSLTSNIQINQTLFDALLFRDAQMNVQSRLAESWSVDGLVWTFKLREGVKFSDGTPLTAEDVVFSLKRIPLVPNAPAPLTIYLQQIVNVEAVDARTVRITTENPYPLVPNNLTSVPIMSAKAAAGPAAEGKTTQQLNAGDGLVGTGPYRFVSWKRGSELVFERNPHYWGDAPEWDKIVYRFISNPSSRVAALQAGDVDLIEDPAIENIEHLKKDPNVNVVVKGPTYRVIFIGLDVGRDNSPGISGTENGANPLKDRRVREAMSLAIDRQAIVSRIMNDMATPAAQLLPYPMFGTRADLVDVPKADLARAKALMAEAGYEKGFNLVLSTPSGRYMNDVKLSQTLAAMWAHIGIKVTVDAKAPSVYFSGLNKHEYSAALLGWGSATGEVSNSTTALLVTADSKKGLGTSNYWFYSNPELDAMVAKAVRELNDAKRSALLQDAMKMGLDDYVVLPLQFEHSIWAMKKDIVYGGRVDQMTMAAEVKSKK